MSQNAERPYCFTRLEEVFPMGDDGLRHVPERCMPCYCKTECLKQAVENDKGATVKQEMLERAEASGRIGFFERWSKRKALAKAKGGRRG